MYFALYRKIKNADFTRGLWLTVTYTFVKNHIEFGKYSVRAMCRVNDMANKIKLDPKSVVRKSVTAALT